MLANAIIFALMTSKNKIDIRSLSAEQIKNFFLENGEKAFRAKQVYEWLWGKSARSFAEMTNLSKDIRQLLEKHFSIDAIEINTIQTSSDKTIKAAFKLVDDNFVEGVLIPTKNRATACISSQVGCIFACKFCATGQLKYQRNLDFDEMYDQVALLNKLSIDNYNTPLSNIVYMGMGEPLLNYENVIKSIKKITATDGLGMSPRRITVSTIGIPKMIKRLGDDDVKFNLAVSLHTANQSKRSTIISTNQQNTLIKLAEALKYYHAKTNNRITYEYVLLKNFNDSLTDAKELAEFCKITPCKVNLIEYNAVSKTGFYKTTEERLNAFSEFLENRNMVVNIRNSRGEDIDAACGQLANKLKTT